ncbi:SRPBCC family protein [Micromonospora sp. PLK6-60]|uniref:SRPBCC family protein n=1 Tax=Micromonospora sp. PLK6-60 TaxID=2873383 RepID=UPI001CA7A77A|nr:SRPBCC family protein [Micromonospora sp. PLK6-60]MBY8874381.1 SRPBCC family protein [Micromonospora sp. PLK6-60]
MTTHTDQDSSVRSSIHVAVPPERAFEVFTSGIDTWWIREHHLLPGELKEVGIDPHEGGRLWEQNDAGEVCAWGRVLTWDPPRTFAFAWLIGTDWQPPAPDAPSSRVTVTFTPTDTGTQVDLVHDRLDAHGPGWPGMRASVAGEGGWPTLLQRYGAAV